MYILGGVGNSLIGFLSKSVFFLQKNEGMSASLTVSHLLWVILSQLLICPEWSEQIAHSEW